MLDESFTKSLFHGVIAESLIFPYPEPLASERDRVTALCDSIRRFASTSIDSARIDREGAIPDGVRKGLAEMGLFGLTIPAEFGGAGLSVSAYARVLQELAAVDLSLALTVSAHVSLGCTALLLFGTPAQKAKYLPALAKGQCIAAFALTEVHAGTDAAAIRTHAERSPDGETFTLRGSKIWVTNGSIADLFVVFARTSPREENSKPKITAFVVDRREHGGITVGAADKKLGVRGATTNTVTLEGVVLGKESVLGELGRGFKLAVDVLNGGRLGLASSCVGMARRLVKMSVDRALERSAFGRPIGEFGLIKDKIAQMMIDTFALESMLYMTTALVDRNAADTSIESAILKIFASETASRVAQEALQIAGGNAYSEGQPWERMLRDTRVALVFEGTNEVLRCFIGLAGMQGPSKALADVAKAMREPIKGFGLLSDFAIRKARTALGRERVTRAHPVLSRESVIFEEYTTELAKNADKVLRRHGRDIAEMQYTQKRIAEMAIDLYAIAAVLSRTSRAIDRKGEEGARREVDLATAFVNAAEKRLAANTAAFDKNDDELRKGIAAKTYNDGGYPFDVL